MMTPSHPDQPAAGSQVPTQAQALISELERMLGNVYADLLVPREKVQAVIAQARSLIQEEKIWPGGQTQADEYAETLAAIERKISQALALKKLKEEGLVKVVKL
ncbi:MAG: hypothetical protein AB1641_00990 [Thermodesulfobacteriota bacterium]